MAKEYVRCYRDVSDKQTWVETDQRLRMVKIDDGMTNDRLSIEDVVLMRIWVMEVPHRTQLAKVFGDPLPLINGSWAGHYFDMIQLEGKIPLSPEYKDVTHEVVEEAIKLFDSIHG